MSFPSRLTALLLPFIVGACSLNAPARAPSNPTASLPATNIAYEAAHETMLLVSLDDGSVIKQTISVNADVCFKQISSSSTICLTQGEPIIDAATNAVIGFEMIEDHIDLIAKAH